MSLRALCPQSSVQRVQPWLVVYCWRRSFLGAGSRGQAHGCPVRPGGALGIGRRRKDQAPMSARRDTVSPPPASKAVMPSMRTRGEDGMPRIWTAAGDLRRECDRQAKSDGIPGGGVGDARGCGTPTRCVQRLSAAVACVVGLKLAAPNRGRIALPPHSRRTRCVRRRGRCNAAQPDSRGLVPRMTPCVRTPAARAGVRRP
jgi:hypothetical protein